MMPAWLLESGAGQQRGDRPLHLRNDLGQLGQVKKRLHDRPVLRLLRQIHFERQVLDRAHGFFRGVYYSLLRLRGFAQCS